MNFGVSIADFRLEETNEQGRRVLILEADNLKSKIENPKWLGLWVFVLVLVVSGTAAMAQQPKKVPRIGYLMSSSDSASESTWFEPIRRALRGLGYIEGQHIAIEYRYAEGKIDRFTELAAELVRLKVDIIVVAAGGCMGPGGHECDQDGSHRYDGHGVRSCRGRPT
jgi:hypothetical protein